MRYPHILAALRSEPWFITQDALESIDTVLRSRLAASPSLSDHARFPATRMDPRPGAIPGESPEESDSVPIEAAPGVAVIRAHGIMGKHLGLIERMCGGCDYDTLVQTTRLALEAPDVTAAVLHIHSRGGMVVGCPEAYDALRAARLAAGKPLIGFVDGQCCSAGYYLAAACDYIVATRSADIGCIGVLMSLVDRSGADAAAGIKRYTIKTGRMKDIGSPDRAPTPEEMATLQGRADYYGRMFLADMQASRPQIAAEVFETALSYVGEQALALGLVDEIVPDLGTVVRGLAAAA